MPRKTLELRKVTRHYAPASMRPRPDAAENITHEASFSLVVGASMRPRPDAAENFARLRRQLLR